MKLVVMTLILIKRGRTVTTTSGKFGHDDTERKCSENIMKVVSRVDNGDQTGSRREILLGTMLNREVL